LSNKKIPLSYLKNPIHFLSLGFGSGLAPFAPGTFGTLVAIPLYWWASQLSLTVYLLTIVLLFALGVYLCGYTSKALGVHDHSGIVWDEIVGYFITMIAVPLDWRWVLAGFVLFRIFDIVKPWPIRWADKQLQGGFGIMFDDVLAGIFALIALHFIIYVI
jgi:phosphatidylglycerophosphatase A